MINGAVTSREALIPLLARGPEGQELSIQAVIDTGYDGSLTLSPDMIAKLNLPWRRVGLASLADGSEILFDIHEGITIWDSKPLTIAVRRKRSRWSA